MACTKNTAFKGVSHIGTSGPLMKVEKNLQFFIDWAYLLIGGWVDIKIGMPGPNGEDASALMPVDCYPNASGYPASQGWRSNWVHETGITYTDLNDSLHIPTFPSGITGNVNYRYGYIENPGSTNAAYSAKQINVLIGHEESWWKELQLQSWNVPDDFFNKGQCGIWAIGAQNRIQMPVIIIEAIDSGNVVPRGLGECCNSFRLPINLHILADMKCDRHNISDVLVKQQDKQISLFDPDFAELPLDCNGFINPGGMQYPDLLANHEWGCARIAETESRGFSEINCGLHEGVVRWTLDVYPKECV